MHGAAAGWAIVAKPIAAAFVAGCWRWVPTRRGQKVSKMDRCWAHMGYPDFKSMLETFWDAEILTMLKYSVFISVLSCWSVFKAFYRLTFLYKYQNYPNIITPSTIIYPSIPLASKAAEAEGEEQMEQEIRGFGRGGFGNSWNFEVTPSSLEVGANLSPRDKSPSKVQKKAPRDHLGGGSRSTYLEVYNL